MKRVSVYLKDLRVIGILSKKDITGKSSNLEYYGDKPEHFISSSYMAPDEEYNVIASSSVTISTYTKDHDTEEFYDLGSQIMTDDLIKIEVRSFEIKDVTSLRNKDSQKMAVCLVDLVF